MNNGKDEKKPGKVRTGKSKQEKMTHEEKETGQSHEHLGRCCFFRVGGCNVPPTYPRIPCDYEYLIVIFFGEELKAKAPPEARPG